MTIRHFIYHDYFYHEKRERLCQKKMKKTQKTKSTLYQRGPSIVFLCVERFWSGQACSADGPENAKETSPTPGPPPEDTLTCLSVSAVFCHNGSYHHISRSPPTPLPFSSFTPSGWNVSTHFSFYALCSTDVSERSLWWCCAGKMSLNVRELLVSCGSESTSVWLCHLRIFPLVN